MKTTTLLLAASVLAGLATPAFAADVIKANNTTALNVPASWTGSATPTAADTAVWNSAVTAANTVNLGASTNWLGVRIADPTGLVTVTNSALTLTLGGGGLDLSAATSDLTLSCGLSASAAQAWNVLGGRTLTVSGLLSGSGAVTKKGDGLAILSAANVGRSGTMTLEQGILRLGHTNALGTAALAYVNTAATAGDTTVQFGTGVNITNLLTVQNLGFGTTSFRGADANGNDVSGALRFRVDLQGHDIQIGGGNDRFTVVGGGISGSGNVSTYVTVATPSRVTWETMNNTYQGNTTIATGTDLQLNSATELIPDTSDLYVYGRLLFNHSGTETVKSLNGSGTVQVHPSVTQTSTFVVGANDGTGFFGGAINRGGSSASSVLHFRKIGSGSQQLDAACGYNGNTTINGGTLTLGFSGAINSSPLITIAAGATFDVNQVNGGAYTLGSGQTLAGSGTVAGIGITTAGGSRVLPGGDVAAGTLAVTGSLTCTTNTILGFDLAGVTSVGGGVNDLLDVTGDVTFNGTNFIVFNFLSGSPALGTPYTVIKCTGTLTVDPAALVQNTHYTATFDTSTPGELRVTFTGSALALTWQGTNTLWDTGVTANWTNASGARDVFFDYDTATLTETTTNFTVNLVGSLRPALATVAGPSNYTFSGTGKLSGGGGLTKTGPGTLTIANTGGNDFVGTVNVSGGTLKPAVGTALGATNGSTIIAGGGTLDINAQNLGAEPFVISGGGVSGAGAMVNSGADQTSAAQYLTLADAATVGGTGRWDVRGTGGAGSFSGLLDLGGKTLTKVAPNKIAIVDASVLSPGNIQVLNGTLGLTRSVVGGDGVLDLGTNILHLENSSTGYLAKPIISSGGRINVTGNAFTLWSSITNTAGLTIDNAVDFTVTNRISGAGSLVKAGAGLLTLQAPASMTSTTYVSAGVLKLDAAAALPNTPAITLNSGTTFNITNLAGGLTLASGQTLAGSGTVLGNVTAGAGTFVTPGLSAGTLTLQGNLSLTDSYLTYELAGTTNIGNSDYINVTNALTLGGVNTIKVVPLTTLASSPYSLFRYNTLTGSAANLNVISDTRYGWTLSTPANFIQVTPTGSAGSLVWKGNNASNPTYWDLKTTPNWLNGAAPDTFYVGDSARFDDTASTGLVSLQSAIIAGPVTFTNNTLDYTLTGPGSLQVLNLAKLGTGRLTVANAQPNPISNIGLTNGTLTFNLPNDQTFGGIIAGTTGGTLEKDGLSTLIFNAANTYTRPTVVKAGTLQIGAGTAAGTLGSASPATIQSSATLAYFRSDAYTINNALSGSGTLLLRGTAVSGQSDYPITGNNLAFTGSVIADKARLQVDNGATDLGGAAGVTILPGGQLYLSAGSAFILNKPVTINGTGWLESAGLLGAIRIQSGCTLAGPITLASNSRISVRNTTGFITGRITGPYELELEYGGVAGGTITLTPTLPNTFASTRLNNSFTAVAGNAGAFPAGPLTMSGSTLRVNGFSFAFANLSGSGTINNNASAACDLTLGADNSTTTYSGVFSDSVAGLMTVRKVGSGTLTLSGASASLNGNLVVAGGEVFATAGSGGLGSYTTLGRQIIATNSGSIIRMGINNLFGNTQGGNQTLPTIALYPGTLLTSSRYNCLGPVVLNNASITGSGDNASYQAYQLRGPVTVSGNAPSTIATSGANNGIHLDQNTLFNVANVTGDTATDLTVNAPLRNRSADFASIGGGSLAGFTKSGTGTMAINGVHTYTGSTVVSAGTIILGADSSISNSAAISVDAGAVLVTTPAGGLTLNTNQVLGGNGSVVGNVAAVQTTRVSPGMTPFAAGTLTFANQLALTNAGLSMDIANTATVGGGVNDLIVVAGDLILDGVNPIAFNFPSGVPAFGVWYTLINYSGALTGDAANLAVDGVSAYPATFDTSVAGTVRVMFSGTAPALLTWAGDGVGNLWDAGVSTDWTDGVNPTLPFTQFSPVRFDDSSFYPSVTLVGTLSPSSMLVSNGWTPYVLGGAGKISGSAGLTKRGPADLSMNTTNAFGGGTLISQGRVMMGNIDALGFGPITLGDAETSSADVGLLATFAAWTSPRYISNPITVTTNGTGLAILGTPIFAHGGGFATIFDGPVTLQRATVFQSGNSDRTTFDGLITGNPGLVTVNNGWRVTWGGFHTNTFTGDVLVSGGGTVFQVGHGANSYGDKIPDTSLVTVEAGAFFRINQGAETIKNLLGDGQLGFAGQNGIVTLAQGEGVFNGTINTTTLAKSGPGTYTLGGTADNNSGSAMVNEGTLILGKDPSATSVHAIGGTLTINGGLAQLGGSGGDQLYLGAGVAFGGAGTLDMNGWSDGFNTLAGNVGTVLNNSATPVLLTLGQNNGSSVFAGQIRDGVGQIALTKDGSGTLTLAGSQDNAYTGLTIARFGSLEFGKTGGAKAIMPGLTIQMGAGVTNQPNLRMNADNQFGTGVLMVFSNTVNNWARFDLQGTTQYLAGISSPVDALRGAVIQNERLGGGFTSADAMLVLSNTTDAAYWGYYRDQDSGGTTYKLGLTKRGPAVQALIGANLNHTGPTLVEAGTLGILNATAWRSPAIVSPGANLVWTNTGNWSFAAGATVAGAGNWFVIGSGVSGQSHYDVNNDMSTFTGPLQIIAARYQADADIELPSGSITIQPGGQIWVPSAGNYTRNLTLGGNGWQESAGQLGAIRFGGGANWTGNLTMTANSRFTPYSAGDSGTISGRILGPYNVEKTGAGTLTFAGANAHTGATILTAGTTVLAASGSFSNSTTIDVQAGAIFNVAAQSPGFVVNAGQTLKGSGTNVGSIILAAGATLSPGASIGTLTITTNLTLGAGSTNVFELSKGSTPANDVVVAASVTYGGTLKLVNLGSALAAGDSFKLFNAGSYSGAFAAIEPASPGAGLAWDTSELTTTGTLKVINAAAPAITGAGLLPDGNFGLTLTGAIGQPYTIWASTNVTLPFASWQNLGSGTISVSPFTWQDLAATNYPLRFYRTATP